MRLAVVRPLVICPSPVAQSHKKQPTMASLVRRRLLAAASAVPSRRPLHTTAPAPLAMKPGTPIPGLNFMKNQDAPVSKARAEYPEWVSDLAKPMVTLAELRRMTWEDSTDRDKMRYLKLTRRIRIKGGNVEAGA